jgi:hypothetical protein
MRIKGACLNYYLCVASGVRREYSTATLPSRDNHWTGMLDWNAGLEWLINWWTGLDW